MEAITANTQDNKHTVSREELLDALRTIIRYIGDDPEREGVLGTPERIARM